MRELTERSDNQLSNATTSYGSISANGFWSKHRDVSYNQLQKFWTELSPLARQELMQIDKPSLWEEARKNMYCSRCNALVAKGFSLIADYEKSLENNSEFQDPSVHPWGGLITCRDGTALTLMDSYLCSESLKALQNVFDNARARERERELLYPDACGGGGRGWIIQAGTGYGRVHGTREACGLHSARHSVDSLVDFWSSLGEEIQQDLFKMKEEDFMQKLISRFDSKRFCRDCRRNVIREFKELKELKRIRRETRCTTWFCVADTCFQYEVTHDTVQADWHETFGDACRTYNHFEWAVGTGKGKSDILEYKNVGLSEKVEAKGLDLSGLNACYITLRAWKHGGRCTELSVKAHALKGQQCVHCQFAVGDGFVTMKRCQTMRAFFEHAEEAEEEEEEDDESMDKDGNDLDEDCSRPQKHAKSPELAREFLLDAATVIFKEQVEKAYRDGTAKRNAHSIFVHLSLKLLEDRIQVACKEIITNAKQLKLLEEEEKERREEEERKERRKAKEKEKKLRKKERLRVKENKSSDPDENHTLPNLHDEETQINSEVHDNDLVSATGDNDIASKLSSPEIQDEQFLEGYTSPNPESHFDDDDNNDSFVINHSKYSRRKPKFRKDLNPDPTLRWSERKYDGNYINGSNKPTRRDSCSCYQYEAKSVAKSENYYRENNARSKTRNVNGTGPGPHVRRVWEPMESQKKHEVSRTLKPEKLLEYSIDKENDMNESRDLFTSSTSNSDTSSSCLSEGDSNSSSLNPRNPESSSASDSEETPSANSPAKTGNDEKQNSVIGSQPQKTTLPQFPILQPPSMNYYHQNPAPWSHAPPRGVIPLAHQNHYVLASPYVPYLPPPVLNQRQLPPYTPLAQKDHHGANFKKAIPSTDGVQNGNNTGFSLFHFGWPVAFLNKGMAENFPLNVPVDHIAADHKKDNISEYNLFASSNGMRFPFL
jgi:hypothetical protein